MIAVDAWRARGRRVTTPDGQVFAMEAGVRREGEPSVLLLHGFPTSSWDFAEAALLVAERRHVVAFDFIGYGLSDKPVEFGGSLFEQADIAVLVARAFDVRRAHVWAHDMGTSVATELCARRERGLLPFEMVTLTLMNGSVHIELAHLTVGQQLLKSRLGPLFARLNSRLTFRAQMKRIFGRPVGDAEIDAMWDLVAREDGAARMPSLIRYTEERARFARRWIGALERLDLPALVAWGRLDPVAVMAIADQLAREIPGAARETWEDLGHYPQVEDAPRVVRTLASFWDRTRIASR